jgi:cytochrome oxidase Cu insertion factor (SCO1/SenC/PrrC family)
MAFGKDFGLFLLTSSFAKGRQSLKMLCATKPRLLAWANPGSGIGYKNKHKQQNKRENNACRNAEGQITLRQNYNNTRSLKRYDGGFLFLLLKPHIAGIHSKR